MMLPSILHWQFIGSNFSTALPPPCTLLMTTDSLSVPPENKVAPSPPITILKKLLLVKQILLVSSLENV